MIPILQWDGQPISKNGIYVGVPMDAYHGQLTVGPSISSSGLRTVFGKSPRAYFRTSYLNPNRKIEEPSDAFIFGRGAHHLLLGESGFRKLFTVRPETYPADEDYPWWAGDLNLMLGEAFTQKPWAGVAKWCRAWTFNAWLAKLTVLTANDIKMIRAMADALAEEPIVQAGVLSGLIEMSFVWRDPETGIWLKWRPDALPTDSLSFSDLKTTADIDDEALERSIGKFGYHQQAALGAVACPILIGRNMDDFSLVFVEKVDTLPCVRTKTIRPADVSLGIRQNQAALRLFKHSLDTGRWLGPGGEQHDNEFSGLHQRASERAEARIAEIERLIA